MLQPVHEMSRDRASGQSKLVRINPTRIYGRGSTSGLTWYVWQNGQWYDPAGHELEDSAIPDDIRANVRDVPVQVDSDGPEITKTCRICSEAMNASQIEEHMFKHVEELLQGSAAKTGQKKVG